MANASAGVHLHGYRGTPLPDEEFRVRLLPDDEDYVIVTATVAQAKLRAALAAPGQHRRPSAERRQSPAIVFHDLIRHLMDVPVLTRSEQRVALQRAAEVLGAGDEALRRQLRHDAEVWSQAIADLDARDLDLGGGVPDELRQRLLAPDLGDHLADLQRLLRDAETTQAAGRRTFERTARSFLDGKLTVDGQIRPFEPPAVVVLEGFTFFTPLQERFIEVCEQKGCTMHLVFAYSGEQARGFEKLRETYDRWWGSEPQRLDEESGGDGALAALRERLFDVDPGAQVTAAPDVTVNRHLHRHHEVEACVRAIKDLVEVGEVDPAEIAIVARNPAEYQSLLREQAAIEDLPVSIGVPPRQLLLTPLGRFVLALYEVRDGDELRLTPDTFQVILASGWLGARAQRSADHFDAVSAQAFARCQTRTDWEEAFALLERTTPGHGARQRQWTSHVGDEVSLWRTVLEKVLSLSERLFGVGELSIGGHVRELLAALEALSEEHLFEQERAIVERISEALQDAADATTLEIDPVEFGSVLAGLAKEREEEESTAAGSDDARQQEDGGPGRVMVTTPEGIDGVSKAHVFYLGVDSRRVPRAYVEDWPIREGDVEEHRLLERYLFLAVVRAATERLTLTYAEIAGEGREGPSPFLAAVGDVLELPPLKPPALPPSPAVAPHVQHATGAAHRERYRLEEVAMFGLCPFRYKLERLDRLAGSYREPFHIGFLAESAWLERVLATVAAAGHTYRGEDELRDSFREAMKACEDEIRTEFAGIRPLEWRPIARWVWLDLEWIVDDLQVGTYSVRLHTSPAEAGFTVTSGDRVRFVDATPAFAARVAIIDKPITRQRDRGLWLIWKQVKLEGERFVDIGGLHLFDEYYRAVRWLGGASWSASAMTSDWAGNVIRDRYRENAADVDLLVEQLERGRYPRRPGDHCRYCPVERDCLGLDP